MQKSMFENVFSEIFPFWNEISDQDKNYICDNSVALTYKKGAHVQSGDECSGVIFVKSGCLRIYMMSEDGKDVTLYRLHDGDMCMLSASCVLRSITFDVYADAEENSECYIISGNAYASLSERYSSIKIFTLETAVSRFSDVMWIMQQIVFMSVDKRLAIFLIDESSRTGSDFLPLTHEQIAKYIGSAREVVSRMLKYFSGEGFVELSRAGVRIVDKASLRALVT